MRVGKTVSETLEHEMETGLPESRGDVVVLGERVQRSRETRSEGHLHERCVGFGQSTSNGEIERGSAHAQKDQAWPTRAKRNTHCL